MFRPDSVITLLILALVAACGAPAARPSPAVSGTPAASLPSSTASPSQSPPVRRRLRRRCRRAHSGDTESDGRATDALVDAYDDGRSRLLPAATIRRGEVGIQPISCRSCGPFQEPATARAAMNALLAGPSAKERSASPLITTVVPPAPTARDRDLGGLATVDLSAEFASLSPAAGPRNVRASRTSRRGRLHADPIQTVDRVNFSSRASGQCCSEWQIRGEFDRGDHAGQARHPGDVP